MHIRTIIRGMSDGINPFMKQMAKRALGYDKTRRTFKARLRPLLDYAVAVLAVSLALLLRFAFSSFFDVEPDSSPFILFVPAVMVAAWFGGLWPGLFATALVSIGAVSAAS